jgi:hypothetical protein
MNKYSCIDVHTKTISLTSTYLTDILDTCITIVNDPVEGYHLWFVLNTSSNQIEKYLLIYKKKPQDVRKKNKTMCLIRILFCQIDHYVSYILLYLSRLIYTS